jgi:thiamine-phosphate diphosphorylase
VVNDHPEIARDVGADAVHVGKNDAHIIQARQIVGADCAVGFSTHSLEEAVVAASQGADYVALGAIFPTATKGPGHPVQGIEKLAEVVKRIPKPVVAIGGINRGNAKDVWATGVHTLAMMTGISQADNIEAEIAWYRSLQ